MVNPVPPASSPVGGREGEGYVARMENSWPNATKYTHTPLLLWRDVGGGHIYTPAFFSLSPALKTGTRTTISLLRRAWEKGGREGEQKLVF